MLRLENTRTTRPNHAHTKYAGGSEAPKPRAGAGYQLIQKGEKQYAAAPSRPKSLGSYPTEPTVFAENGLYSRNSLLSSVRSTKVEKAGRSLQFVLDLSPNMWQASHSFSLSYFHIHSFSLTATLKLAHSCHTHTNTLRIAHTNARALSAEVTV